MGVIYFIRHGESRFNRYGENTLDVDLTDLGRLQSMNLTYDVDLVICSPLFRARQTLRFSKLTYRKLIYSELCSEHKNGLLANYLNEEETQETDEMFQKRIAQFMGMLVRIRQNYNSIAVVTHHGVIGQLTGQNVNNCHTVVMEY